MLELTGLLCLQAICVANSPNIDRIIEGRGVRLATLARQLRPATSFEMVIKAGYILLSWNS
jgi:hypothetical protein